ncbi:MAG: hypothetical protein L6R39_003270, partial [Caloplaca ligustica]
TGDATPFRQDQDQEMESPEGGLLVGKRDTSRGKSPLRLEQGATEVSKPRVPAIEIEDTNMKEDGEVSAGPDKTAYPVEGLVGAEEKEDGEQEEDAAEEAPKLDEMDVS